MMMCSGCRSYDPQSYLGPEPLLVTKGPLWTETYSAFLMDVDLTTPGTHEVTIRNLPPRPLGLELAIPCDSVGSAPGTDRFVTPVDRAYVAVVITAASGERIAATAGRLGSDWTLASQPVCAFWRADLSRLSLHDAGRSGVTVRVTVGPDVAPAGSPRAKLRLRTPADAL
jgi:hypothetical protein